MFNYEGFKKILRNKQEDLLHYLTNQLKDLYSEENQKLTDDYLFFKGECPVCLVCHLDTVHAELPTTILCDKENGLMWSPQGIGGDDRCGVFAVLYILSTRLKNNLTKPSILFTTSEEVGCIGAGIASIEIPPEMVSDLKFLIEIDRRGKEDCVFYNTRNKEFEDYIESFGFVKAHGSCSDISKLSPSWDIASTNLSSGYFSEHTKTEYINVNYLMDTINKVLNILNSDRVLNGEKFTYQPDPLPEPEYTADYWNGYWRSKKNSWDKNSGFLGYDEEEEYLRKLYGEDWKEL